MRAACCHCVKPSRESVAQGTCTFQSWLALACIIILCVREMSLAPKIEPAVSKKEVLFVASLVRIWYVGSTRQLLFMGAQRTIVEAATVGDRD